MKETICWWSEDYIEQKRYYETLSSNVLLKFIDDGIYTDHFCSIFSVLIDRKIKNISKLIQNTIEIEQKKNYEFNDIDLWNDLLEDAQAANAS